MTSLADTETRILEASSDIAEGDFDRDRNEQAIAVGSVWGVVTVHKGDCVSLEAHGLTAEQAAALLRALTPGWKVLSAADILMYNQHHEAVRRAR
jgi:hypothetical protein